MDFLRDLNKKQYEAVVTNTQYARVIAGAGSGKTRVLTYRVAYLISEIGIPSQFIWALTFTNKAANEMKKRVVNLLKDTNAKPHIQTIHSFCARFLREEITVLNYLGNFTIYDEDDQLRLIKDIAVLRGHMRRDPIVEATINYISHYKNEGKTYRDVKNNFQRYPNQEEMHEIWKEYERRLSSMNALDFDDLLLFTKKILEEHEDVRRKWQHRISYLLVDEFQDTNNLEFAIMMLLLSDHSSFYVVGDPDQTIYTWRGANANIMLNLDKHLPVETFILDENYRSTQTILDAANMLISHNQKRIKKNLYTNNMRGEKVTYYCAKSAYKEAEWVLKRIFEVRLLNKDAVYKDFAILLRANYLTLPFESVFMARQTPYRIYGGVRFYQRKVIKDALAYFRLLVNEKDDMSVERICNIPPRGLSTKIELMKEYANLKQIPLLKVLEDADKFKVNKPNQERIRHFLTAIKDARKELENENRNLTSVLQTYLDDVGYFDYIKNLKDKDESENMFDHLMVLFDNINTFLRDNPAATFDDYLENAALLSAQDEVETGDYITIMTVHMAKGLEYDYVFVANLNEGIFPNSRAVNEGGQAALEEERRLCYVAFTRAKKQLFLSHNMDYNYVSKSVNTPSQFLTEAGIEVKDPYRDWHKKHPTFDDVNALFEEDNPAKPMYYEDIVEEDISFDWNVGDELCHEKFGHGVVLKTYPSQGIIDVQFDEAGVKKLIANHKLITKIRKEDLS